MSRYKLVALIAACALPILAYGASGGAAVHPPTELNRSLVRQTEQGHFRVTIASATNPIPLHRIHRWTVQITDQAGRPVRGAAIGIGGGMPQHGHGLPTAPTAAPSEAAGTYVINGMKFSMDGWWELRLNIAAGGVADRVTFNIVL